MSFVQRFQHCMESLHTPDKTLSYVIAYSGGVDSHVLLYCCKQINLPIRAIHVHHGLQSDADNWVEHCKHQCELFEVPLDVLYVDAAKKHRQSPEESARNARYDALTTNLKPNECLLTAQHLNDQAETLLIQLTRAAGSAGLAAMLAASSRNGVTHLRPLLSFTRKQIVDFAIQHQLQWVEDPSNQDSRYDRNFLRNEVIPLLETRWPEIVASLAVAADTQSSNLQVLDDMAMIDLETCHILPESVTQASRYKVLSVLSLAGLKVLSKARRVNLLRYWINAFTGGKAVSRNNLEEFERVMLNASSDANPVIMLPANELRTFKGRLYLLKALTGEEFDAGFEVNWEINKAVSLPYLAKTIRLFETDGKGLDVSKLTGEISIRFRQGGEVFHPAERQHSQKLKKLLQETDIAYWDRASLPLVYLGDELIAVADLWVAKDYVVDASNTGLSVVIE